LQTRRLFDPFLGGEPRAKNIKGNSPQGLSIDSTRKRFETIDEYIKTFPEEVQAILEKMRQTIRKAAPEAEEAISYQIPTFKLNGNLVHFAAFKNHISFFPTSRGIAAFKKELSRYKGSKGTVQFPLEKPIPYDLVRKITTFRRRQCLGGKR
jgi:uncharacterized protein YdhG (YjbR/CyaY superfamily)